MENHINTTSNNKNNGLRSNREISSPNVRLVGADGAMVGVVSIDKALRMAMDVGLDLVEVSPNAEPPVCKILDFGKFKYEAKKKAQDAKKKQKIVETKEIKLRPAIGQNDYDVKLRSMIKFIKDGNKVKVTIKFRGREITHQDLGLQLLTRIQQDLIELCKVEVPPRMEGKQLLMILASSASK